MKIKRFNYHSALIAVGVCLGRGAQADTIIDFDNISGQNNAAVDQSFGDYASASSTGVTVTGFGTPNIGVAWSGTGDPATRWEYYNNSVWSSGQLNHSIPGTANDITFTPNSASASVVIKSFNFFPYYDFATYGERFTFDVSVLSGTNVVSGPIHLTFQSDGTKNHPVNVNYTGAPGQTLKLRIARSASVLGAGETEGFGGDIAADDITFAQLPTSLQPFSPQVLFVNPADDAMGISGYGSYLARITNGASSLVSSSIKLSFDGNLVTPTISSSDGLTNVSYNPPNVLAPGSQHLYILTYTDSLAVNWTNFVQFNVANYLTLPPSYALPPGSGIIRGFTYRTVAAPLSNTNSLDSTVARAKAQLAGTLIDPSTGQPFTNAATPGTNDDGSFNIDTVLNFSDIAVGVGNFPDDVEFPGLDTPPYDWFSTEARLYLDLPAGYYRLGVNSDDGFELNALPPQGTPGSAIQLAVYDDGRAPDDTLCDFLVQSSGVYPFQLIYFESTGGAECEFYSVNLSNLVTNQLTLINDPADSSAIKSYRVLRPHITRIVKSGTNANIDWAYGTPPFQLQSATNLNSLTWSDTGSSTTNRTTTVPIQPGMSFFRVYGK